MVDFIFVVIELFRYLLRLRRYERKSVEVGVVRRGWVTLSADFRRKGASSTNHCWCQKTRVIAVSCGIKIFAVRCLVFSQYTHLTDRRTDRRTELRQQYRALHYMQSHGKNLAPWNAKKFVNSRNMHIYIWVIKCYNNLWVQCGFSDCNGCE